MVSVSMISVLEIIILEILAPDEIEITSSMRSVLPIVWILMVSANKNNVSSDGSTIDAISVSMPAPSLL